MEIVFNNSEKGIVDRMLHAPKSRLLGTNMTRKKLLESALSLSGALDIGSIRYSPTSEQRKQLIRKAFYSDCWSSDAQEETEDSFLNYWSNLVSDYARCRELAQGGESIRIWYRPSPGGLCGLCHMSRELSRFDCKITTVKFPPLNHIQPETLMQTYTEDALSAERQEMLANVWDKLVEEDAPLRVLVNGHLVSAQEDFYDSFIFDAMNSDPFIVSHLIVDVLRSFSLEISDFIISERLKALLRSNVLKVLRKEKRFYDCILQRQI